MTTDPNQALDGATTALHRRIEELTAGLAEMRTERDDAREERDELDKYLAAESAEKERLQGGLNRTSAALLKTESDLATERSAREQAEKDLVELRATCRALAEDRDAKTEELRKLRAR